MSLFQYKPLTAISNVAANTTVTINVPVGPTYHFFGLEFGGATLAQMKNIQVLVNGKPIQVFADGNEVKLIDDYYGRHDGTGDGFLALNFAREEMETTVLERMTALGTANVQTLAVSIDIDAAAVNPTLQAFANQENRSQPLGLITKIKRFPVTYATTGEQQIDNLPRGPRMWALHLKKADVSAVRLLLDGQEVRNASKDRLEYIQQKYGRVPQTTSMTSLDFHLSGHVDDLLVTGALQEFRIMPTIDSTGSLVAIAEYLDQWAGI